MKKHFIETGQVGQTEYRKTVLFKTFCSLQDSLSTSYFEMQPEKINNTNKVPCQDNRTSNFPMTWFRPASKEAHTARGRPSANLSRDILSVICITLIFDGYIWKPACAQWTLLKEIRLFRRNDGEAREPVKNGAHRFIVSRWKLFIVFSVSHAEPFNAFI